jgi:hypothetical protein
MDDCIKRVETIRDRKIANTRFSITTTQTTISTSTKYITVLPVTTGSSSGTTGSSGSNSGGEVGGAASSGAGCAPVTVTVTQAPVTVTVVRPLYFNLKLLLSPLSDRDGFSSCRHCQFRRCCLRCQCERSGSRLKLRSSRYFEHGNRHTSSSLDWSPIWEWNPDNCD